MHQVPWEEVAPGNTIERRQPCRWQVLWANVLFWYLCYLNIYNLPKHYLLQTMQTFSWLQYLLMAVASFNRIMHLAMLQKTFKDVKQNMGVITGIEEAGNMMVLTNN